MEFLIKVLVVYGISAIVTQSRIFKPLRDWAQAKSPDFWSYLTNCMQCFPFWCGIFVSLLLGPPMEVSHGDLPTSINFFFTYLFSGALYSGTSMLLHTAQKRMKEGLPKKNAEEEGKDPVMKASA